MKSLILCCALLAAASAAENKLGKPLTLKEPIAIDKILAEPAKYAGKTVQVKGAVREVCQHMGCWMEIADAGGQAIRIKVNDGEIVFPKDAAGKTAIAEGKLAKITLTRDQAVALAKHEAEVAGRKFDPESIKSGKVFYQIQGTGAVIFE